MSAAMVRVLFPRGVKLKCCVLWRKLGGGIANLLISRALANARLRKDMGRETSPQIILLTMKIGLPYIICLVGLAAQYSFAFITPTLRMMASSSSSLDMVRNRGLERREEGATPLRKL